MSRKTMVFSVGLVIFIAALAAAEQPRTVRLTLPDGVEHDVPVQSAAEAAVPEGPFGTGYFYTWLGPGDFRPKSSNMLWDFSGTDGYFYQSGGGAAAYFIAPLSLPAGALLQTVRLYYYDDDETSGLALSLCRSSSEGLPPTDHTWTCPYSVANVVTDMPNYSTLYIDPYLTFRTREDLEPNGNPNDVNWSVMVQFVGGLYPGNRVRGVRLYWKLQISPAPATATFTDVPLGSGSFQAVEALAASGITAGCGATTFCPNQAVTRAQMALFLARALGLTWNY